jgi:hypothetical protein
MQGSARKTRQLTTIAAAVATLSLALVASADANPLLSGYGGPGEGSQAILGSALIGGPPSSGGPSEGPGGGTPSSAATTLAGSGAAGTTAGSPRSSGVRHGSRSSDTVRGRSSHATAPGGTIGAPNASGYAADAYGSAVGRPAFGFSDRDLLIMLLAILGIAITALVTRRFARLRAVSGGVVAKGVPGTTRRRS